MIYVAAIGSCGLLPARHGYHRLPDLAREQVDRRGSNLNHTRVVYYPIAKETLNVGKHVFLEKPHARTRRGGPIDCAGAF